jgi:PAS domain-containing protein
MMSLDDVTPWLPNSDSSFFDQGRFDALFRYLPVPIYLWELDGESFNPKLIDCNDAAVLITGKGFQKHLGKTLRELLPHDEETHRCLRECLLRRKTFAQNGINPFLARPMDLTYIYVPANMAALVVIP